jgi:ribose/xylose/arabinose/galactoside ABC-type transport system permease subunit
MASEPVRKLPLPYLVQRFQPRTMLAGPVGSIGIGLFIVLVIGSTATGGQFLTSSNGITVGDYVAAPVLIAAFSSFSLLAGTVDLSIGSMAGLSAVIFAELVNAHKSPWLALLCVLGVAIVVGTMNAVAIVRFNAEPLAATLGMLTILAGLSYVIDNGQSVPGLVTGLFSFVNANGGPLPLVFEICVVATLLAAFVLFRTRWGYHVKATGGDERAAARAGISVAGVKTAALILSAIGAGLGGILYVGQEGAASSALGADLEFQVYAALMIGGFSILRGGVGNPVGGLLGLLVVAGVQNILDLRSVNVAYGNLITGIILIIAVLLDRLRGGEAFD